MHGQSAKRRFTPQPTYCYEVLFFVPNLICYLRLALLVSAEALLLCGPWPWAALACHVANLCLDAVDGEAARRLNQATAFGAFLDVVVDNLSRATLWGRALPGLAGAVVPALESATFACTHKGGSAAWKQEGCFSEAPAWVRAVMANNFRTPVGALAVAGLMGAPLWFWARRVLPAGGQGALLLGHPLLGVPLLGGRCVAAAVELWVLRRNVLHMIRSDGRQPSGAGS